MAAMASVAAKTTAVSVSAAYFTYATALLLLPCNGTDLAQAWLLPTGATRLGGLLSAAALVAGAPAALTVGESTLYAAAPPTTRCPSSRPRTSGRACTCRAATSSLPRIRTRSRGTRTVKSISPPTPPTYLDALQQHFQIKG
jgi:hypothetical protein